jgi:hypothetical protein
VKALAGFSILAATAAMSVALSATGALKMQTIAFTSVQVSQHLVHGKYVISNNDFVGSKQVGHDQLTCTQARCDLVVTVTSAPLAQGTIAGWFKPTGTHGTGTITSGTGAYSSGKGAFTWKNLNKKGTKTAVVMSIE